MESYANQYSSAVANQPITATTVSSASRASDGVVDTVKKTVMYNLNNVKKYVQTRSVTFWIVIGTVLVVFICLLIYEWWRVYSLFKQYIDCTACYIRFRNVISNPNDRRPILHNYLVRPNNGYTYSMWLYVAQWENQIDKWKNVYYRGPPIKACKNQNALQWDSFSNQQPGVWMAKGVNNIRVVVSTNTVMPSDCVSGEGGTSKTTTYGNCTGTQNIETTELSILEYADIADFPIGEWFQLLIVVNKKRLELYLNGKLVNTLIFVGEYNSTCDMEDGHFGAPGMGTFTGRIMNFRYMPFVVPYQMIDLLYIAEKKNPLFKILNPMKEQDISYQYI